MKTTTRRTAALVAAGIMSLSLVAANGNGNGNGKANGAVGCELTNGDTYDTPAAMLKALTDRDGHFQETVDKYSFASVGDLIDQKCGH